MIASSTFECFGCVYLFLEFGTEFVEGFDAALGYHYPALAGSGRVGPGEWTSTIVEV